MTTRKAAKTVPATMSRFVESRLVKRPPPAFYPMLAHPPSPSLVKDWPLRPPTDSQVDENGQMKSRDVVWVDDMFRDRFYKDHPFEAYRPKSLSERQLVQERQGPQGLQWYQLGQRTRNPLPEDAIDFAVNLYEMHGWTEGQAYMRSIQEYRTLRSEHETATRAARLQAKALGAQFFGEVERGAMLEERALDAWKNWQRVRDNYAAKGVKFMAAIPTPSQDVHSFAPDVQQQVEQEQAAEKKLAADERARQRIRRFREKFNPPSEVPVEIAAEMPQPSQEESAGTVSTQDAAPPSTEATEQSSQAEQEAAQTPKDTPTEAEKKE